MVSVERTVFYREKAAGMYSAMPYAMAQASSQFPSLQMLNESRGDVSVYRKSIRNFYKVEDCLFVENEQYLKEIPSIAATRGIF